MKEDFDFDFEDFGDFEEELDELPKEGTPLYNVMKANGILTSKERRVYERYDQSNLGCAMDRPVLIEETEDYIHLEYEILAYLLRPVPYRFVDYGLEEQRLICHEEKYLDALLVRVYTHPLLDMDENGNLIRPEPEFLGTEEYWFDITAGYNAMGERLKTRLKLKDKDDTPPLIEGEIARFKP